LILPAIFTFNDMTCDVRQVEIYTIEPLGPEPNPFEVEIAIANMKSYELPGSDQIPAQLI
jgi:hypothetical protein